MDSNIQTSQDDSDLPTYQTGNSFVPYNNSNDQHASINNLGASNTNNTTLALQNDTFEFYFPLSNDTRIYHVTYQYTELHPLDNARLLNNNINLSRIPDHQLPLHYNIQSLIRQQIQQQQVQKPVYQQNNGQQQLFDSTIQPISQIYSDNSNGYNTVSNSVNGTITDNVQQDPGFQNFS
ncbi:hypothetical protein RhiirA5_424769 [Rhizophagus irregularis]|uniref:Uncharacterized protein n=1 Tax=Rhizophagus irregularis TaxID=588596 RepID=A0A2I1F3H3_9GLOM|nr:hypothetical protein RhiirA5_424769 [Rhizophagus irregularis]PKC55426.1 hypothetical protein RhiirA1_475631 [Rhizophagus irregularis]PKY28918.1 hypothetical protein RhiirB3_482391 [Rhizophagus irregularis]CAB4472829.1 unnamed protein product [Rhizophagus irregularis]CAB5199538.1 unnamed protein product [Rhizophagus irregularis]